MYKGLKRMISIILAVVLASFTAVTAFAESETDSFEKSKQEFYIYVNCASEEISQRFDTDEDILPALSEEYVCRFETAVSEAENAELNTEADVEAAMEKFDSVYKDMTVHKAWLTNLIEVLNDEVNPDNYYDESTWNEFNDVLDSAKSAVKTNDEHTIHSAYLALRTEFNKLCLYNAVAGDLDHSGEVDVDDVTYLQKAIAFDQQLTISQYYILYNESIQGENFGFTKPSIDNATAMQRTVAGIEGNELSIVRLSKLQEYANYTQESFRNKEAESANLAYIYYTFYSVMSTEG